MASPTLGRRIGIACVALGAALLVAACGTDNAPPDAPPGAPTLAAIRADIFNTSCGLSSCHAPPTLAAKLNLKDNGLCHLLVTHTSCLFGNKLLVVPGKPNESFLLDKLRGANLTGTPDPACATSNQQMPLGQTPLSGDKLAQVEQWIKDGASCGDDVPGDAGVPDGPRDGEDDSRADVAAIAAVATTIHVGERTQVTVTLTHGAPTAGQTVILEADDDTVLGVSAAMFVAHGGTSATFDVIGRGAAATATVTGSAGTNSKSLTMTVLPATLSGGQDPAGLLDGFPLFGSTHPGVR